VEEAVKHLVSSSDGTPIASWRTGQGPPRLLVHGMVADHSTTWRRVLPDLQRWFTVYAMDRRGRGGSGDSTHYALQREAEDVAAVVDVIRQPVFLVGHSFGGLRAGQPPAALSPRKDWRWNRLGSYG
jgi:pimeloyl-ACP methyl ester carboxylesterase